MPLGHHHNLESLGGLFQQETGGFPSVLTTPPQLINPTSNESALLTIISNPCFDAKKDCTIPPILQNPNACELAFLQLLMNRCVKTRACNLIPMFSEPCSLNLTKLILFVTPPQPGGSGGFPSGAPAIEQPCDDFDSTVGDGACNTSNGMGPNWTISQFDTGGVRCAFLKGLPIQPDKFLRISTVESSLFTNVNARGLTTYTGDNFADAQSSEAVLEALPFDVPAVDPHIAGLGVRMSGTFTNMTAYVAVLIRTVLNGSLFFRVYRIVNCSTANDLGCWVQVGSDISPVPSVGDKITLAVSALDIVTVRVNDILVFTDSDITLDPKPTSGRPGFISATNNTNQGDNFTEWNNWCGTGAIS